MNAAEAAVLGRYALGKPIAPRDVALYCEAIDALSANADLEKLTRIEATALRRPAILPFVDSALALRMPGSGLRQRLLVMAAVLETNPLYCDRFLPVERSWPYAAAIAWAALRAVCRAIVGLWILALARA